MTQPAPLHELIAEGGAWRELAAMERGRRLRLWALALRERRADWIRHAHDHGVLEDKSGPWHEQTVATLLDLAALADKAPAFAASSAIPLQAAHHRMSPTASRVFVLRDVKTDPLSLASTRILAAICAGASVLCLSSRIPILEMLGWEAPMPKPVVHFVSSDSELPPPYEQILQPGIPETSFATLPMIWHVLTALDSHVLTQNAGV